MMNLTEKVSAQQLNSEVRGALEDFRKMRESFGNSISQEEFNSYLSNMESQYGIECACELVRKLYSFGFTLPLIKNAPSKYRAKFGD